MKKRHEIHVRIDRYSPSVGSCSTTHRLTTPLGLNRVLKRLTAQAWDQKINLTFKCRTDAVALGLYECASGEWVTASMESVQVEIDDELASDFPAFLELMFGYGQADSKRKNRRQ